MIKLKKETSPKQGDGLTRAIQKFIRQKPKVVCPGLNRRPVSLTKYLEATQNRSKRVRRRQKFWACIELIGKVKDVDMTDEIKEPTGELSFEFKGITPSGEVVGVHIRQEIEGKDKKLYLVSTF